MFSSPFPPYVGFSALCHQLGESEEILKSRLTPSEQRLLGPDVHEKRRSEFYLGRAAAHRAMASFDPQLAKTAILRGELGEPLWPEGVVGAITHAEPWAIAAVASKKQAIGLGIDLESVKRTLKVDISRHICCDEELSWIKEESSKEQERLISLFSAKESIYKALRPLSQTSLGFKDALLYWDNERNTFVGSLTKSIALKQSNALNKNIESAIAKGQQFEIGCRIIEGFVFTYLLVS